MYMLLFLYLPISLSLIKLFYLGSELFNNAVFSSYSVFVYAYFLNIFNIYIDVEYVLLIKFF
jgi:hypothetical protein